MISEPKTTHSRRKVPLHATTVGPSEAIHRAIQDERTSLQAARAAW